jgi:hypothetical protein
MRLAWFADCPCAVCVVRMHIFLALLVQLLHWTVKNIKTEKPMDTSEIYFVALDSDRWIE